MADYLTAYHKAWDANIDAYLRIYHGILAERRANTGQDWNSSGGRHAVAIMANGRMRQYMFGIGWAPPATARKIVYGELKGLEAV